MSKAFISIGESLHASIPKVGEAMKQLVEAGGDAYTKPSEPLDFIRGLIESQVADGADYIEVNVDAFGEDDPRKAVEMMREYVKLVRRWGKGVPVCIDSSDDNVLEASLAEWYATEKPVKPPLLNSIKAHTMDQMFALKKDYDYGFIALLMKESDVSASVDELYGLAKRIFEEATGRYDFEPGQIFFDPTVFPLAIDMPMQAGEPSRTYKAFETIKRIKADAEMAGVHCTGGISNCARDLPARKIGIMRAYVHKAMEFGLDSGIVNVKHHLEAGRVDPELLRLVDAYAKMDGSPEKLNEAMMLMGKFCQQSRQK